MAAAVANQPAPVRCGAGAPLRRGGARGDRRRAAAPLRPAPRRGGDGAVHAGRDDVRLFVERPVALQGRGHTGTAPGRDDPRLLAPGAEDDRARRSRRDLAVSVSTDSELHSAITLRLRFGKNHGDRRERRDDRGEHTLSGSRCDRDPEKTAETAENAETTAENTRWVDHTAIAIGKKPRRAPSSRRHRGDPTWVEPSVDDRY